MAHAFFVPNQAELLTRVYLQERRRQEPEAQVERINNWLLLLSMFLDLLFDYIHFEWLILGKYRTTKFL